MNNPPPLPGTPGRSVKILIVVGALAATVAVYYFQLKPQFKQAMAQAQHEQKKILVLGNLSLIGQMAESYFLDHADENEVSVWVLREHYSRQLRLNSILGEDYDSVVVPKGWKTLAVRLPDGDHVAWTRPAGGVNDPLLTIKRR